MSSIIQDFALSRDINARERAILASNRHVAQGWTIAATYARMVSNAFAYLTDDMEASMYLGRTDALRHCLWAALLTHQVGEHYAQKLTDAHEREGEITEHRARLDREMDLHNNRVGIRLGKFHSSQRSAITQSMTAFFLFGVCKSALDNGELKVIDRRRDPWRLVPSNTPGIP